MPSRLDRQIDMHCPSLNFFHRINPGHLAQDRSSGPMRHKLMLVFVLGIASSTGTWAEEAMPEGMKGWWYYNKDSNAPPGYARTPQEACAISAANHWGGKLFYMTPSPYPRQIYECFYKNPVGGLVFNYSNTVLHCENGYTAASPGVCTKWMEPPRPPSCSPDQPGYAIGNPTAVASGAKVQTETDIPGSPNGALRVARTYRTLRMGTNAQSAGPGWSFSFDRGFNTVAGWFDSPGDPPEKVDGAFGDGTYFEFIRQASGIYVSSYDKREALRRLTAASDDWVLTTRTGTVERFKSVNGKFRLVSSHTREGAGQFYTYGTDGKLATITDASGRSLAVTWAGDVVASITGATGSVRYGYELAKAGNDIEIAQTERLATVEYSAPGSATPATQRYHYEDPNNRYLLTGITDENGARFATYAYNATGQTMLSEHAGGTDRYSFAYPAADKRIITDPLGTEREISLAYAPGSAGVVASTSQPGGAGCRPGASKRTYDQRGQLTSSTDFNERKSCFITEPTRGLLASEVSGLTPAAACPASASEAIAATSRRMSKQWHPDVDLETAVASAKQIVRYVYNGQPGANGTLASCAANATLPNGKPIVGLCSRTVQATRDANGAAGLRRSLTGAPGPGITATTPRASCSRLPGRPMPWARRVRSPMCTTTTRRRATPRATWPARRMPSARRRNSWSTPRTVSEARSCAPTASRSRWCTGPGSASIRARSPGAGAARRPRGIGTTTWGN
jgi:YD repeat-containing protein